MVPLVMLALESAMRRGELLALRREHINLASQTAHLPLIKNGTARTVPLSRKAVAILDGLPNCGAAGPVFPISHMTLHNCFVDACRRAKIDDLTFHDLRHTATSRLAEKLPNVIELAAHTFSLCPILWLRSVYDIRGDSFAMIVRLYLRASTDRQHADRAEQMCKKFAIEQGSPVNVTYTENASGASLERKAMMRLIGEAKRGEVLLVESIDRLTRLKPADWKELSDLLRSKGINVVAVDFPLSHRFMKPVVATDEITEAAVNGICMMMLDVLAAMAHVDYTKRHERTAQGRAKRIEKDKKLGPDEQHLKGFKGRQEDVARNERIRKHLSTGAYSWLEIMKMETVSRGTVAKQAALLKAAI